MIWLIPGMYLLFLLLLLHRNAHREPHLRSYPPLVNGPFISVIIPARNEAANIERCLRSILRTSYESIEVIVVDDRSSDGTAEIVEQVARSPEAGGQLRLVRGAELPAGWFGKPWALVQAYRVANGTMLLFTDADTRHAPELIPRCVAAMERERVDLLSVLPRQEMVSFWERLVQPHVFLALASRVGGLERVNRTRVEWDGIANGQFILTSRAAYDTAGTHAAVNNRVAEDLALAQAYVRHGLDIFLVHGPDYMTTRMYRTLTEIVEGWSKNLAIGVPLTPPIPWLRRTAPYLMWVPALAWIAPPGGGWAWRRLGRRHYRHFARRVDRGVLGRKSPRALRFAISNRSSDGGVHHVTIGMAGGAKNRLAWQGYGTG